MHKYLESIIKTRPSTNILVMLFCLLFTLTPMMFSSNTKEHYEFPKMFFVYFIVTLATLVAFAFNQKLKKPSNIVLLFLLSFIVSTLFSVDLYTSVWGYYSRFNDGLVSVLVFFAMYLVLISRFNSEFLKKLFFVFCLVSIPISIYGLFNQEGALRVYSTFGQPNWLGAYLAICLSYFLFRLFQTTTRKEVFLFSVIGIIVYACLWRTYSFSAYLGLLISFVYISYIHIKIDIKSYLIKALCMVVFMGVISASQPGIFEERLNDSLRDFRKFITFNLVVHATNSDYALADSGYIRKGLWESSVKMFFSSTKIFAVGIGPETFPYIFPFFRVDFLNYSSEWDYILNKPHNYYLEVLVEQGLLGFISYGLLLGWVFKKLSSVYRPSFIALLVTNVFGWPTVAISLVFWLFISMAELTDE